MISLQLFHFSSPTLSLLYYSRERNNFIGSDQMRSSMLLSPNSSSLTYTNLSKKIHKFGRNNQNPSLFFPQIRISTSNHSRLGSSRLVTFCSTGSAKSSAAPSMKSSGFPETEVEGTNGFFLEEDEAENKLNVEVGNPNIPTYLPAVKLTLNDQVFFLLAFIACTTSIAFTSLVVAAVPTLYAMGRAAISLSKLADTAREELPSTMAAIRLSGMEISDLTLELSDLSQEIADGVNKSAQVVQAAEAGIRQIGSLARQQTVSMIQERASLPIISIQPVVAGAAKKTSRAVGRATKTFMNIISRGELSSDHEDHGTDRIEL